MEDTFPDLGSLSDKELKDLIDNLTAEENEISYKRRVLHGKIDILRAELVNRLRQKRERGDSMNQVQSSALRHDVFSSRPRVQPRSSLKKIVDRNGQAVCPQQDGRHLLL